MSLRVIAKIAVEKTVYSFDKTFDYLVPMELEAKAEAGKRVLVPFGRGNRKRQGIIMSLYAGSGEKLKEIFSLLDAEPVLSKEMLKTAEYMKEHYFCTLYEAVKTMLPAGINYKLTTLYGAKEESEFSFEKL